MRRDQDFPDIRFKWRCSQCDRLNSLELDNVCPKCFDLALDRDQNKRAALAPEQDK